MANYQGTVTLEVPVDIQIESSPKGADRDGEELDKLMAEAAMTSLGASGLKLMAVGGKWSVNITGGSN